MREKQLLLQTIADNPCLQEGTDASNIISCIELAALLLPVGPASISTSFNKSLATCPHVCETSAVTLSKCYEKLYYK